MTIRKGEAWGIVGPAPADVQVVHTDAAAREWVLRAGERLRPLGLGGGDLARTAGGGRPDRFTGDVLHASFDAVRVEADDGDTTWSVAHVVARRGWLTGPVLFAMTAQYLGRYDVAPRAHPNDGLVDVLATATMPARARLAARHRARTGTHLPHPDLTVARTAEHRAEFDRVVVVWVDGVRWRTTRTLHLTVEPDAYTAYV